MTTLARLLEPSFGRRRKRLFAATCDSDTHPKDGDVKQAPLVSGAGRQASPQKARKGSPND